MNEAAVPVDTTHDVLIVIPTLAKSQVLLPSFERLLQHLDGLRVNIVASVNAKDEAERIARRGCGARPAASG